MDTNVTWNYIRKSEADFYPDPYKDVLAAIISSDGSTTIRITSYFEGTGGKIIWMGLSDSSEKVYAWTNLPEIPEYKIFKEE